MSRLHKLSAIGASLAMFFVPLVAAHAQVYSDGYYPTTDQYYENGTNSDGTTYYPNSPYDNYYNGNTSTYYYPSSYDNSNYGNSYYGNSYYGNGYYNASPTCTLSITTPNTYDGSAVTGTLSWTSNNAYSAYISAVGPVNTWGSTTVYAYPYETFTMTVTGPGGSNTCQTQYIANGQVYNYYQPYSNYTYPTTYPTDYSSDYYSSDYYYDYTPPVYTTPVYVAPTYVTYNPINYVKNWWHRMGW